MDQDPDGEPADGVERAEHVERRRGAEAEDGLPFVQHYESLQEKQKRFTAKNDLTVFFYMTQS